MQFQVPDERFFGVLGNTPRSCVRRLFAVRLELAVWQAVLVVISMLEDRTNIRERITYISNSTCTNEEAGNSVEKSRSFSSLPLYRRHMPHVRVRKWSISAM
ncbi:hypothetical protein Y032_0494g2442 [Ancylostoma ceylanicum]|uniref:Uncharacterized protein n=1 Tax=Ancylostoma ceylanicum TaxID=53326 RepID=A0A016WUQ5_9BILA|nr:hypothetical protein Y032_0494g2442 [Ancylostoma ceylanicum]